jgi:hypothetical protein
MTGRRLKNRIEELEREKNQGHLPESCAADQAFQDTHGHVLPGQLDRGPAKQNHDSRAMKASPTETSLSSPALEPPFQLTNDALESFMQTTSPWPNDHGDNNMLYDAFPESYFQGGFQYLSSHEYTTNLEGFESYGTTRSSSSAGTGPSMPSLPVSQPPTPLFHPCSANAMQVSSFAEGPLPGPHAATTVMQGPDHLPPVSRTQSSASTETVTAVAITAATASPPEERFTHILLSVKQAGFDDIDSSQ